MRYVTGFIYDAADLVAQIRADRFGLVQEARYRGGRDPGAARYVPNAYGACTRRRFFRFKPAHSYLPKPFYPAFPRQDNSDCRNPAGMNRLRLDPQMI